MHLPAHNLCCSPSGVFPDLPKWKRALILLCDCGFMGLILNTSSNSNKWETTHWNDTATGKQSPISPGTVDTTTHQLPRAGELLMDRHVSPLKMSFQRSLENSRRAAAAKGPPSAPTIHTQTLTILNVPSPLPHTPSSPDGQAPSPARWSPWPQPELQPRTPPLSPVTATIS